MLLFCLARNVVVLKTQDDFRLLTNASNAVLGSDIVFELAAPVSVKNGTLDCAGRKITAKTYLFNVMELFQLRNCEFQSGTRLAAELKNVNLTNVSLTVADTRGCDMLIYGTSFYGVNVSVYSRFASLANQSSFIGCAFQLFVEGSSSPYALFSYIISTTIQNTFVNASVTVNDSVSVASLALESYYLQIFNSRFISNITAIEQISADDLTQKLSGCVMSANYQLLVRNCDFATTVLASGKFNSTAGIVSLTYGNSNVKISDTSSYFAFSDKANGYSPTNHFGYIGNLVGWCYSDTLELKNVTAYNNIQFGHPAMNSRFDKFVRVSGLVGGISRVTSKIANIFVVGSIEVHSDNSNTLRVGGCFADNNHINNYSTAIENVSFSGDILVTGDADGATNDSAVGGIIAYSTNCTLRYSYFIGNISLHSSGSKQFYIGAIIGQNGLQTASDYCYAIANLTVELQSTTSTFRAGCIAGSATSISNSFSNCQVSFQYKNGTNTSISVGLLAGSIVKVLDKSAAEGSMTFYSTDSEVMHGVVGGLVGSVANSCALRNLTVHGSVTAPVNFETIATAFGSVNGHSITNVIISVEVHGTTAAAYVVNGTEPTPLKVFVDCDMLGNQQESKLCNNEITNGGVVAQVSDAFAWNSAYNNKRPYLTMLPILAEGIKYILPRIGSFSASSYYIDDSGLPFPITDYKLCRGLCNGDYNSVFSRICVTEQKYCLDFTNAQKEFPDSSCLYFNAICASGVSFCDRSAQISKNSSTYEYECKQTCSGCQNGYCNNGTCVCDVYNSGSTCTYKCDSDEPVCFGDSSMMCNFNNTKCILVPSCSNITCLHGSCIPVPSAHCECDNLWDGEDCGTCPGFGKDCNMTALVCSYQLCFSRGTCKGNYASPACRCDGNFNESTFCERCNAQMEVIEGSCACGRAGVVCENGFFCYSGVCAKSCLMLDTNCQKCDPEHLDFCSSCKNGFSMESNICKEVKESNSMMFIIIGVSVAGCIIVGLVILIAVLTSKNKKAKVKKNIPSYPTHSSSLPLYDLDLPKPIVQSQVIENQTKRKVKKMLARHENDLFNDYQQVYTGYLGQTHYVKLEPVRQSGEELSG